MPNNYILLPGFDVDGKDVEERKLQDAPARVAEIIRVIREHQQNALYQTGSMPGLKSYWIYPLFAHLAIGSNSFRVTDACISCGYVNGLSRPERSVCREGSLFGRIPVCSVSLAFIAVRFVRSNMGREQAEKRADIITLR